MYHNIGLHVSGVGTKGWLAWRRWVADLGRHSQRKKAFLYI